MNDSEECKKAYTELQRLVAAILLTHGGSIEIRTNLILPNLFDIQMTRDHQKDVILIQLIEGNHK
jgi:hypothetical protein